MVDWRGLVFNHGYTQMDTDSDALADKSKLVALWRALAQEPRGSKPWPLMKKALLPKCTVHCPLPTANCPLPTAHCPLPTVHCPTVHCLLPTAHCPLSYWPLSPKSAMLSMCSPSFTIEFHRANALRSRPSAVSRLYRSVVRFICWVASAWM